MSDTPLFTVFTATFNRAAVLHRVYEGLQAQSLQDFEWLIVDDGSTDDTAEKVAAWIKVAQFKITYIRQQHAGKHVAYNRAIEEAQGSLFTVLDSDDGLLPHALEKMKWHWKSIPEAEKHHYWAVAGLACDENGKDVGDRFPASPFDASFRDIHYVHRIHGEKFFVSPTAILRRYPFPAIPGTQFIPEAVVWFEIAKSYKHRSVNETCRIYYSVQSAAEPTLSSRKNMATTAPGRLYYYVWLLNNDLEYFFRSPGPFLKAALMLPTALFYSQQSWRRIWSALKDPAAKCLVLSALLFSVPFYFWYRSSESRAENSSGRPLVTSLSAITKRSPIAARKNGND
jgi:glycosyltransferase involved in cell wall biosynthesis